MKQKWMTHMLAIGFGLMWIISGSLKAMDPDTFYFVLSAYKLFPVAIKWLAAFYLPAFEIMLGIFFIFQIDLRRSYLVSLNLLAFFIIILSVTLFRGLQVNCGCFSTGISPSNIVVRLVEDIVLLILALWGLKHTVPHQTKMEEVHNEL